MSTILIHNVLHQNTICDILIENKTFKKIAPSIKEPADKIINAANMAIIPPFYNTHTHAAMTLLRGYADDLELFPWLRDYIWPAESKLNSEIIYDGTRLAILEMIKSGTVFFNDMYFFQKEVVQAAEEMGIRAAVGAVYIDGADNDKEKFHNDFLLDNRHKFSDLITVALAPHAIYTVCEKRLQEISTLAAAESLPIHIHAAESAGEVAECLKNHGKTPIAYLDSLGLLTEKTVLAHCVHLSDDDIALIKMRRSIISHMPSSNIKLCCGMFRYHDAFETAQCQVTLGTDGCASNNDLSMLNEIKMAALSAKCQSQSPTSGRENDIFNIATLAGAQAFGINAGEIAVGRAADCVLVDLNNPFLAPNTNLIANLVYSADSSCVNTVICNGRILMEDRLVPNEKEIIQRAAISAAKLLNKE